MIDPDLCQELWMFLIPVAIACGIGMHLAQTPNTRSIVAIIGIVLAGLAALLVPVC